MEYNYDEKFPGKYAYLPKVGQEGTYAIKSIKEVKGDNPKFQFTKIEKVPAIIGGIEKIVEEKINLGYHIECELEGDTRILTINSIGAFLSVFKNNNVQPCDTIYVKHLDKGLWEVKKLTV